MTGLSRSTVSTLVSDLIERGLVGEQGEATGAAHGAHGGRPPVPLALERSAGAALGIDFGHTHVRVAVADLSHEVLAEAGRELDVDHSAAEGLDAAAEVVEAVLAEAGVGKDRVLGVGMGLPGPISRSTGAVGSSSILPGWVGVDAAREMSERLGLPVRVENDANLGALAELVWGAGQGDSDIVYIKLASGIGAGLVLGGRLYRGAGGTAGEIGHTLSRARPRSAAAATAAAWRRWPRRSSIASLLSASRGEARLEPSA